MEKNNLAPREKDRRIVELVHSFLLTIKTFRNLYQQYKNKSLHFADMAKFVDDRGESILFRLKELSRILYRQNSSQISEREQLFDLLIGSIFHLAMKMREDLYQLEFYGPKYLAFLERKSPTASQKKLIDRFADIISHAGLALQNEIEEINYLLENAIEQFPEFLFLYRENSLLLRFLMEETNLVEEALGKNALSSLYQHLYGPEEFKPYFLAGESYFQGGFYQKALRAFTKALEKKPGDENIQFKIYLSQGMDQFYSFAPQAALKSLEKCLSLAGKISFSENYRNMIKKACLKIQEEFPGRRKDDQHRDLVKKAQDLLHKLDKIPIPPPLPL